MSLSHRAGLIVEGYYTVFLDAVFLDAVFLDAGVTDIVFLDSV